MFPSSLTQMLDDLSAHRYSARELTQHFLDRISRLDGALNSYITTTPELALTQADNADRLRAAGSDLPLLGIPLAHKDIYCTAGVRTTAGSRILDTFISPYDATVVERLATAGAVTLGKTNMDEFAMGSSNENSYFGPVHNPWHAEVVPGGSSGGSAAAVAALLAAGATGTDTGGSIRQPAAMCGITGIKPTYGRISRWGIIAYASSLDQAGPMARNAEDTARLLQVMAGFDPRDSTSIDAPVPDYVGMLRGSIDGVRIGVCAEYFAAGLDTRSETLIQNALRELEKRGARLKDVSLPHTRYAVPAYYMIAPAECSANLSRYDGVRFGYRCPDPVDLEDLYTRSRSEGFGSEVKQRIMVGTFALSAGYYDAYYRKAQQIRRLIKEDFVSAFGEVDLIAGPVSPAPAFRLGEKVDDPIAMYLQDIYTIASNLAGLPAMSSPVGFQDGLPVGIQFIGNYLGEGQILNVSHQYQQVTDWHNAIPEGFGAS
jgi:aspartyl-tRNA(Asn)/glutamyl-tRNA(Gln) amidotransferase subunit A